MMASSIHPAHHPDFVLRTGGSFYCSAISPPPLPSPVVGVACVGGQAGLSSLFRFVGIFLEAAYDMTCSTGEQLPAVFSKRTGWRAMMYDST